MPAEVLRFLIFFIVVPLIIDLIIQIYLASKDKQIKEQIRKGEKIECSYIIRDKETFKLYVYGIKDKRFDGSKPLSKKLELLPVMRMRLVYKRFIKINGKECEIIYTVNDDTLLLPKRKVTKAGRILGLR